MLTAAEVAGLIAAMFWAILVCFLAMVLVKAKKLLDETAKMVSELGERVVPLLDDVAATVAETNRQLVAVEAIATDVKRVSGDMAKVTGVATTLVVGPLIKISALGHGVRSAARSRVGAPRARVRHVLAAPRAGRERPR